MSSSAALLRHVRTVLVVLVTVALMVAGQPAVAQARRRSCQPLSLRQQTAQTVMTGLPDTEATAASRQLITRHAGNVLLLGHNIVDGHQVADLIDRLRQRAPAGLLVAVDEEGGRVARLADAGAVMPLPSARTLAHTASPPDVRAMGVRLGRQLRRVGVDVDLGPVLDVTNAPAQTVIGDRAYSDDPAVAGRYGRAFARGLRDAGVLTAGKHFPGHGRAAADSHDQLPRLAVSQQRLRTTDLRAFRAALPSLDAVMTAHVVYADLDPNRPASLSPEVIRLLRDDFGYDGVVMTDALEMGAITTRWEVSEAAELALRAGTDLVMVGDWRHTAATTDRLIEAVGQGRLPRWRLQEAARRVLRLKGRDEAAINCLLGLPPTGAAARLGPPTPVPVLMFGVRPRGFR